MFTTRPDTLFGATYMVLAPEHPLVDVITANQWPDDELGERLREQRARRVEGHLRRDRPAARRRARATATSRPRRPSSNARPRAREKTGVFTGAFAINPTNDERIPIFVADYVLMGYGTGAIMAVPAHDERDFEFAREFDLPIVPVIRPSDEWLAEHGADRRRRDRRGPRRTSATASRMNSANDEVSLDGLRVDDAKRVITEWLERAGSGEPTVTYKLRDWLFSRQRYWGEPFPIVYDDDRADRAARVDAAGRAARDHRLRARDLRRSRRAAGAAARARGRLGRGRARPARARSGRATATGRRTLPARDEHDAAVGRLVLVLPALPRPDERGRAGRPRGRARRGPRARASTARRRSGLVDLYVGGVEHAVLHLLYARFWHKVLFDLGHVSTIEPFQRLVNQGYILAAAYIDERGVYVEAARGRGARRRVLLRRHSRSRASSARWARACKNAVAPDDIFDDVRRRHAAALRDVHGPARRVAAVEHRRHRRRAPLPAAAVAQRRRRGDRRSRASPTRRADDETRRLLHRTIAAVRADMADAELQHRDRPAVRAEQPPDARSSHATVRAPREVVGAAGADGRAARAAHRRGAVGAARPRRHAHLRAVPDRRPAVARRRDRSRSRCRSTARCGRAIEVAAGADAAAHERARAPTRGSPSCSTARPSAR